MLHPTRVLNLFASGALIFTLVARNASQGRDAARSSPPVTSTPVSSSAAAQFEAAPGVTLPANGIVWVLDLADNNQRLARVYPNYALANGHRVENFIRAQFVVVRMRSTIYLLGPAAKLRLEGHIPAIFVRRFAVEDEELQSAPDAKKFLAHYELLRLRVAGDRREVCTFTAWQLGLKPGRHEEVVASNTEEGASGQWLKITPKQPLPDGEYAVVNMPDNRKQLEPRTYDFGIGAAATQAGGP